MNEGNSGKRAMTFLVEAIGPHPAKITASFATSDGTAVAGSDYVAATGSVSLASTDVNKPITIAINGDRVREPNETFTVRLVHVVNATVVDDEGVGTILNDDLLLGSAARTTETAGAQDSPLALAGAEID